MNGSAAVHDGSASVGTGQIVQRCVDLFEIGMVPHDGDDGNSQSLVESREIDDVESGERDAIDKNGVQLVQKLAAGNALNESSRRVETIGPHVRAQ